MTRNPVSGVAAMARRYTLDLLQCQYPTGHHLVGALPAALLATSGHTARTMPRSVLPIFLVVAIVAACTPQAVAPPRASTAAAADAPTTTAVPSLELSPLTASPTPREMLAPPDAATASPGPSAAPSPAPIDAPSAEAHSVNLARVADFVPQYTSNWCVGASLQMARSIITGNRNEARRSQRRLWEMARDRSPSPYGGANPIGWTAALNDMDLGPYRLVSRPTFDAAVRSAARALRRRVDRSGW